MALLFYDGFDWSNNSDLMSRKYYNSSIYTTYTSYGRFGTSGVIFNAYDHFLQRKIPSKTTVYIGRAVFVAGTNVTYESNAPFMTFYNDSTIHVRFHLKNLTTCAFYNGSGTQIGTDITIPNIFNKWFYLEIKVTISDTVGAIILRINNVEYYNGTNLDTRNGTPTDIDSVSFRSIYWTPNYIDDIYIDDSQFHGDVRVRTIYPDANGSENDFTVYPSGSNYQAVDETPSNNDTDYNSANTVGDRDLYGVTAPTLATVKAIAVNNMVRKDDAGTRKTKNVCRSGGSNYLGSEFDVLSTYAVNQSIWELDPQDSAAWTKAKIDAAEFGLEITA